MAYQIAHRGWSEHEHEENTRSAFKRAGELGAHGVEFDVRWNDLRGEPVVCHYRRQEKNAESLDEVLSFLKNSQFSVLLLELKECHPRLWEEVKRLLIQYGLLDKTIIFAFPKVAKKFPWSVRKDMRLGIIALFPWSIKRYAKLEPDVILFGYDKRKWTQIIFRLLWWDETIRNIFHLHPSIKFIIGVAQNDEHIAYLESFEGLYGYTLDKKVHPKNIDRST